VEVEEYNYKKVLMVSNLHHMLTLFLILKINF
jgi:hypothetical protein